MWKCHKCGKPVYFAERKQSLGYDWHPECLRCEECGKRLNPGQHAEHKGVPYCHVPCYGALFGPQLFGHGTRVESHKSYGQQPPKGPQGRSAPVASNGGGPALPRDVLDTKLKAFNDFLDNRNAQIRCREVNGRMVLEGALRVYWGVQRVIHLKEDDDQRTVVTIRKRNSCKLPIHYRNSEHLDLSDNSELTSPSIESDISVTDTYETTDSSLPEDSSSSNSSSKEVSPAHISHTLPPKFDVKEVEWDEIDDLLQVERKVDNNSKLYRTMPSPLPSQSSINSLTSSTNNSPDDDEDISTSLTTTQQETSTLITPNPTELEDDSTSDNNTLKACDFDEFKKQVTQQFLDQTNEMQSVNDGTLKSNQPIDPSRINDSLKLYSEGVMSKSFHGMENSPKYSLQKSGSATLRSHLLSDDESWLEHMSALNRSKSGPNCFGSNSFMGTDDESTLKPSTLRKIERSSVNIRMDCYDDQGENSEHDDATINGAINYDDDDSSTGVDDEVVLRRPKKPGSTAIKRRSGNRRSRTKIKRRCSINGHFYNRETSFFTPPHGSQMSVWVSSLLTTQEIVNLLLEKYKVESHAENFTIFIIRDNGEQRRLREDDYPLMVRVLLGPHEDVAKLYLVDSHDTPEISSDVAQFLNLSIPECRSIMDRFSEEEEREMAKIKERYAEMRLRIIQRMESLKVRL